MHYITQKLVFCAVVIVVFNLLCSVADSASIIDCDKVRNDDKVCLACNLYHEARGEEESGIFAVALVTMNRVKSSEYPNSICEVVWQDSQFSWTGDGRSDYIYNLDKWNTILEITGLFFDKKIRIEVPHIDDLVLWYHRYDINPRWSRSLKVAARVGNHKFFKKIR